MFYRNSINNQSIMTLIFASPSFDRLVSRCATANSRYYAENSFWIVNIENLECTYLNGGRCRHFYVFKSFFIQCNYLLARGYPTFYPLCIQIHVCHVGSTHVRTNRLFLIPRTNINYSQTIRAEYRKYLFIRSTNVQSLRSSN